VIRAVLVVGWAALVLLAAAGATGFGASDEETAQRHLVVALFATAALLFANLCVAVYLQATRRLVRRAVRELALPSRVQQEHGRPALRGTLWAAAAALPLLVAFFSGFPAFGRTWPPWPHQAAVAAAAVLQPLFLLFGGRALLAAERRLAALAEEVEGLRYTSAPSETPTS
jgi:hypothetical protein